jgi:hypothetical protein
VGWRRYLRLGIIRIMRITLWPYQVHWPADQDDVDCGSSKHASVRYPVTGIWMTDLAALAYYAQYWCNPPSCASFADRQKVFFTGARINCASSLAPVIAALIMQGWWFCQLPERYRWMAVRARRYLPIHNISSRAAKYFFGRNADQVSDADPASGGHQSSGLK